MWFYVKKVWFYVTELRRPKYFNEIFNQVTPTLSDAQEVRLSIGIAVLQYNKESPSQLVITLGRASHKSRHKERIYLEYQTSI